MTACTCEEAVSTHTQGEGRKDACSLIIKQCAMIRFMRE
jgi:hypothetical protein